MREIFLAGGCFWGMQKYFDRVVGVITTQVGYANGRTVNPTYEEVCCGNSNFTETVWVRYNENIIDFRGILDLFFKVIDPTARNRQGSDFGTQYRSGIYYTNAAEGAVAREYIEKLQQQYARPIVTEVEKLRNYYTAEPYHQNYLEKNPGGYCHIGKEAFQYAGTYTPLQTAR
ncbi:peptide-methionine (S)-S-oxide reductase MsrA [Christensenella intestinihominis]|uniref:peptide-methionine (S)-S-oxide reductase MsrA n=1 Tax=Christensenella intestinihominis TaxID=1851429 RepID=UPI00082B1AF5|nr:peptide-methionine (S)-S-oxide reductase MsrA [Christensenella intestinihominis]